MGTAPTKVTIGDSNFDVAGVGGWISHHIWLFLLFALVAFIFFLFQKGGFAEKLLDYRMRAKELDAKKLDDMREVTDILRKKFEREDPLLPFDGELDEEE